MRRFELYRFRDPSGVSGTGVVAHGVEFLDGSVSLRWLGPYPATAVWPDIETLLAVHGHLGASEVRWLDPELEEITAETSQRHDLSKAAASLGEAWQRHDDPRAGRS
jgi:hypothetical protein